jgi:hypothetical protein
MRAFAFIVWPTMHLRDQLSSEVEQHQSYNRSRVCLSLLLVSSTDSSTDSSSVVCADEEARASAASWQEGGRHLVGYW